MPAPSKPPHSRDPRQPGSSYPGPYHPLLIRAFDRGWHDLQAGHHLVDRVHQLVHVLDGTAQRLGDRRLLALELIVLAPEPGELRLQLVNFPAERGDLIAHPIALRVGGGRALPEPLVVVEDAGNDASEEILAFLDPAFHLLPRSRDAGSRHVHPEASPSRVGRPSPPSSSGFPCVRHTVTLSLPPLTAAPPGSPRTFGSSARRRRSYAENDDRTRKTVTSQREAGPARNSCERNLAAATERVKHSVRLLLFFGLHLLDDLVGQERRHFLVMRKLHRVAAPAAGHRAQRRFVGQHLRHGDLRAHGR